MSPTSPKSVVSINGKLTPSRSASLSIFDRAILLGFGLYETALAFEDTTMWLSGHMRRFETTRKLLALPQLFKPSDLTIFINTAVTKHPAPVKRVRIFQTAGGDAMWAGPSPTPGSFVVIVQEHDLTRYRGAAQAKLVQTTTPDHWLSAHKGLSRMHYHFPIPEFKTLGPLTLFYSAKNGITEFSQSAVILRKGYAVTIAPDERRLPSLTLEAAVKAIVRLKTYKLSQRKISLSDLRSADELISLSSLRPALSIGELIYTQSKPNWRKEFRETLLADQIRELMFPARFRKYLR